MMAAPALPPRFDVAALVAAGVTVVLWASAFVGIRSAGSALAPGALSLGRLAVAFAVLLVVCRLRHERLPSAAQLKALAPTLLPCGILWFGAYNLLLNSGERRLDAGTSSMLVNIGPLLIAILAALFLHEGFPRTLLLGCTVAFAGVAVIALASARHTATTAGVLLCLGAAVAYAGGAVTQKVVLRRLSALQTIFLCALIGVIFFLPFAPQLASETAKAPAGALAWMVYLGAGPTAVGFVTWAYALSRTPVGRLGATTYLVPPLSVLFGWLLLDQTPAAFAYLGGALCLAGVALSRGLTGGRRKSQSASGVQRSGEELDLPFASDA